MGWFTKLFQRFQLPGEYSSGGSEHPRMNDRDVLESIADFDEDPDVRRAARELLMKATDTAKQA